MGERVLRLLLRNMLELSKQVVSLESAKQLKKLGVPQQSLFYWVENKSINDNLKVMINFSIGEHNSVHSSKEQYSRVASAFTVAELGELLPTNINGKAIFTEAFHGEWLVGYPEIYEDDVPFQTTEANARAYMLIYLIENKLITLTKEGVGV